MFNKNSTLKEINDKKGSENILAKHNVPCISCPFAKMEMDKLTIGQICNTYGLNLKEIIDDLNKL